MFKFLKSLLSTPKIIETGMKGIDAAFFTDEEKSKFMLEYLKATAPMAVARRFIAIAITILWCMGIIVCGALLAFDSSNFGIMSAFMSDTVNTPFSVIMGFYFLAHVISKAK